MPVGYSKGVRCGIGSLKGKIAGALLVSLLGNAGCARRTITLEEARNAIVRIPGVPLPKDSPLVQDIRSVDSRHAVVEADVRTVFHLEKRGSRWAVVEVRLADGKWLKVEEFQEDLLQYRIQRAETELNLIALGLARYRLEKNSYPEAENMLSLSNQLFPRYMNKMISADPWGNDYLFRREGQTSFLVFSRGPDGKAETKDDLRVKDGPLN